MTDKFDAPQKRQRDGECNHAECGDPPRRHPPQIPALQNRAVQNPDRERQDDLGPGHWFVHKKSAEQPRAIENKTEPKQPCHRGKEIGQRWQMIKN